MKTWHEDDEFWRTTAPYLFDRRRWENASGEIEGILQLTEIPPKALALDLCCGPGRHSLELARRGFQVTGVDRNSEYLDQARSQAEKEGLEIELIQEDMRRFRRPCAFHLALSLYTSFGYFKDPREDVNVIENLWASLKPGGKLVMEMMGREVLTRVFRERDWQPVEDGGFFLEERKPSPDWTWMDNRWILVRDGAVKDFRISLRIYGAADLTRILRTSGFGTVDLYGSLQGSHYDHAAKRLVVVAIK